MHRTAFCLFATDSGASFLPSLATLNFSLVSSDTGCPTFGPFRLFEICFILASGDIAAHCLLPHTLRCSFSSSVSGLPRPSPPLVRLYLGLSFSIKNISRSFSISAGHSSRTSNEKFSNPYLMNALFKDRLCSAVIVRCSINRRLMSMLCPT